MFDVYIYIEERKKLLPLKNTFNINLLFIPFSEKF